MRSGLIVLYVMLFSHLACCSENLLVDSFDAVAPGRWEDIVGDWVIADGSLMTEPKSGDYQKSMTVCNFPLENGVIEAVLTTRFNRAGSFGIIGKYIDQSNYWHIRFAYWTVQLQIYKEGKVQEYTLFPYSMVDLGGGNKQTHLQLVIIDGRVGFFVDNTLITVFKDPLAGRSGRPGLSSESTSYAHSFQARRTK